MIKVKPKILYNDEGQEVSVILKQKNTLNEAKVNVDTSKVIMVK